MKRNGEFRTCKLCQSEFYIPHAHLYRKTKPNTGQFCSMSCYHKFRSQYAAVSGKRLKICLVCGKGFTAHHQSGKFCSIKCFGIYRKEHPSTIKRVWVPRKHSDEYKLKCRMCGIEFIARSSAKKFCGSCQQKVTSTVCQNCGKEFSQKNIYTIKRRRFCSIKCGTYFTSRPRVKKPDGICNFCKKSFRKHDGHTKFCSKECFSDSLRIDPVIKNEHKRMAQRQHEYRKRASIQQYGSYTVEEWNSLCDKYGNRCLRCGKTDVKLTADHILPLSRGGDSTIQNIQPLCARCNSRKHAKTIDYRNLTT